MAEPVVATPEEAEWLRKYFQELVDLRRENKRLKRLLIFAFCEGKDHRVGCICMKCEDVRNMHGYDRP